MRVALKLSDETVQCLLCRAPMPSGPDLGAEFHKRRGACGEIKRRAYSNSNEVLAEPSFGGAVPEIPHPPQKAPAGIQGTVHRQGAERLLGSDQMQLRLTQMCQCRFRRRRGHIGWQPLCHCQ
jgi:hypothetical protein